MGAVMTRWTDRSFSADADLLDRIRVLELLPASIRESLTEVARCERYRRREGIDWEEEQAARGILLFCVPRGSLRISFLSSHGKELPIAVVEEGHVFDLGEDGWSCTDDTIVTAATETTIVCSVPRDLALQVIATCPEAALALFDHDRRLLCEVGGAASDRLHGPAERIDHIIFRQTRRAANHGVQKTHEEVAMWAGTTQSHATQELGQLRRKGVIETDRKKHLIVAPDPDRLIQDE